MARSASALAWSLSFPCSIFTLRSLQDGKGRGTEGTRVGQGLGCLRGTRGQVLACPHCPRGSLPAQTYF